VLFRDFPRGLDRIRRDLRETNLTGDFADSDRGYVRRFDEPPASAAGTR
jgi:hypothetical protein